ncbi:MAG: ATP-grasp domain-containing protein [Steroidobacteraceae bacterium]
MSAPVRRAAFLTLADPTGFVMDDDLAIEPLALRGWAVETVPWNRSAVDWARYDLAVIRSTWDYQHHTADFLVTLAAIEKAGVRLENGIDIVRWNIGKTYLRELETKGVPTVPTLWRDRLNRGGLLPLFDELQSELAVIKPVVSGNAEGAWRLDRARVQALAPEIETYYAGRALMMQPFERGILDEGEYSLVYFCGVLSHGILKVPKSGDFRVQEEHGADIRAIRVEPELRAAGDAAIAAIGRQLLYARADLVRSAHGFRVMELELVEPALYLRMDVGAPERFALAVDSLFV